jgi:glycosyltransferase involved in cell wall biosynthesis
VEYRSAARASGGVLLLGPSRSAVSGVSTHVNQLLESALAGEFHLSQFQVGREGRAETRLGVLARILLSPVSFLVCLIRLRPRIVHINTSLEPRGFWRDLIYFLISKALRRRVVYQVHGGAEPATFFGTSRLLSGLLRAVLNSSDAVVLLSASDATAFRKFAPRARSIQISNAVPIEDVDLSLQRYASSGDLRVIYLGRLALEKGIFEAIEAIGILRGRGIAVRLTIAGSGSAEAAIGTAIEAAGLSEAVCLVGAVSGRAKSDLWRRSEVLVFPSYREGLPYALLEAMSFGVVPVATPVGAIPEVLQDGDQGLLVPVRAAQPIADALATLATDRLLLHRLAVAARRRVVERYGVQRLAEQFRQLYQKLV